MKFLLIVLLFLTSIQAQVCGQDIKMLLDSSNYYWQQERYQQAFAVLSKAVAASEKAYESGEADADYVYAYVLNQMGVRLFAAENYETAATYYQAAIPLFEAVQGSAGADYLVTMENLALCYNSAGKSEEALELYTQLLENPAYREAAGPSLYQTYNTAAICAYQSDRYEVAKNYYQMALGQLTEESEDYWVITENLLLLEKDWGKYGAAYPLWQQLTDKYPDKKKEYPNVKAYYYRDLAHAQMEKGNYAAAIPLLVEVRSMLVPTDSIDRLSVVYATQDLAASYVNASRYIEGWDLLIENEKQAAEHYGVGTADHLHAINYLALAASELGKYRQAARYFRRAYQYLDGQKNTKEIREFGALFDTNYTDYLLKTGKHSEAEVYCRRALDFYQQDREAYFDDVVFSTNQLGMVLLSTGIYEKAEAVLKQALKMQMDAHGVENEMATKIASNLTALYIQTGRNTRATQFLQFILANDLKNHGEHSYEYSFSLQVAGTLFTGSGEHDLALDALKKAYAIRKKLVGDSNREVLRLKQSLGTAYYKAEKYEQAATWLEQVMKQQERMFDAQNFDLSLTQNDLALVRYAQKNYSAAMRLFKASYQARKAVLGDYNQFTISSLYNMASTFLQMGEKQQAFQYFKQAMDDYLHVLDHYFPYLSEKERLEYFHTIKGQLAAYFAFLESEIAQHPEYAAHLYNLRMKTKSMLLNESRKLRNFLRNHTNPQVRKVYQDWVAINEEIAKRQQLQVQPDEAYMDSLRVVGEEYERVLNSLTGTDTQPQALSWQDIAASLAEGEVAVEIIRIKGFDFEHNKPQPDSIKYIALVVDSNTKAYPAVVNLGSAVLDTKYYKVYKNNMMYKLKDAVSYGHFWKPLADVLGQARKVYLSADGVYHLINPATLYDPAASKYLVQTTEVQMVGNTHELLQEKSKTNTPGNAVLFGFPAFNVQPDESLHDSLRTAAYRDIFTQGVSELPGTHKEVADISGLMKQQGIQATTFVAEEAHEQQLKRIASADILHIATHGFFDETNENVLTGDPLMHSGLLMAGIRESTRVEEENGILTAKEVAELNLQHNQLVVLSACETGRGQVIDGEGVYGLQRAFQVAGSANVIISLWKVDDTATQQLMTLFYSYYLGSNNARSALRQAQLELSKAFPHPYYWGAFYVVGE